MEIVFIGQLLQGMESELHCVPSDTPLKKIEFPFTSKDQLQVK